MDPRDMVSKTNLVVPLAYPVSGYRVVILRKGQPVKFKQGPPPETTLDIHITDMELRFTPGGKRVLSIYAEGFESIHFRYWGINDPTDDDRFQKWLDLKLPCTVTVTGQALKRQQTIAYGPNKGETRSIPYFYINTWETHTPATPLPDNITEVPY